jgi:hypothetical protein
VFLTLIVTPAIYALVKERVYDGSARELYRLDSTLPSGAV